MKCTFLIILAGFAGAPLMGQSQAAETQFIAAVNSAITNLVTPLSGASVSRITFGGQLVYAHGSVVANASLSTLLGYVDGLKAAGVQRVEFNPGLKSMSDPFVVAKYDAVVRRIRQLGMYLALNPEVNPGELGAKPTFQDFQNAALPAWQQMAARYQPDVFIIVHEASTMDDRMGLTTNVQNWHNFIVAAAPLIKAASPHTRVGAGGFQNGLLTFMSTQENLYWQDFVTIPALDVMTMDIYNDDTFTRYTQWINLARTNHKGIYIEETWAPHYLPIPLPAGALNAAGYLTDALDDLALVGSCDSDFADMDKSWLQAMSLYAAANGLESITPFTTEAFFRYGSAGHDQASDATYSANVQAAIQLGQLTAIAQAYNSNAQKWGIQEAVSLSSASYSLVSNVFGGTFADSIIAPDELVSVFGADLATGPLATAPPPYPTKLGGTTITLVDSGNTSYKLPLYAVLAQQAGYLVPAGVKTGPAVVTVTSGDGTVSSGAVLVAPVAPGIYTANSNGKGTAAAVAVTVHADGTQAAALTFSCGTTPGSCVTRPISLGGASDIVIVELYGTGVRHLSSLAAITAQISGRTVPVLYAGATSQYPGLDQINLQIPRSLAGLGLGGVVLTVQDTVSNQTLSSNTVTINIQ